jgi:hypothetical protein
MNDQPQHHSKPPLIAVLHRDQDDFDVIWRSNRRNMRLLQGVAGAGAGIVLIAAPRLGRNPRG